jgi:N-acetylmuramoyl-L-alanine amidase
MMPSMVSSTTEQDRYESALCVWREARGEGLAGMTAVACVIRNRVVRHRTTFAGEVMRKWAFSSMTAPNDKQIHLLPGGKDPSWAAAQHVVEAVIAGLDDNTQGATLYYDDSISFPKSWDRSRVLQTVKIGRLNFFREF